MNTANLQLEGLYAAFAALLDVLRDKGVLSADEIEDALSQAEQRVAGDPQRPSAISQANVSAVTFPLRLLREANRAKTLGQSPAFGDLARRVGLEKQPRC